MSITLNGSERTVFVEGESIDVEYLNNSQVLSNNTSDRFNYRRSQNSHKFYLLYSLKEELEQNKTIVSRHVYDDLNTNFGNDYNISPFVESEKVLLSVKNNFHRSFTRTSNGDVNFLKDDFKIFIDKSEETIDDLIKDSVTDPRIDYPFTFNYNNFFARGSRIDAFSNVNKLKRTQTVIDDLKGIRQNGIGTSFNAFGLNNRIEKYYTKKDDTTFHYEDDINNRYLYNNEDNIIIDKIVNYLNPVTGVNNIVVTKKKRNIKSEETRYFAYKEVKESPFREKSYDQNSWWIDSKYKFSNENINDTILSNRDKDNIFVEDKIYASLGRDLDKSINSISESIAFCESLN